MVAVLPTPSWAPLAVSAVAALIAIPVGAGGGIFLAEYSRGGWFAQFIRFGTNVLSGVPSIIAGVFIYGTIVTSRVLFGNAYSAPRRRHGAVDSDVAHGDQNHR